MKHITYIILSCFLIANSLFAQDLTVYTIAQKMPEFPGGTNALSKYLMQNVHFPAIARETGLTGKAYVNFIVDTGGTILSPKIIKSSGSKDLNDEALRVVSTMPNWIAGSDSGKKVNVYINLPIIFSNNGVNDRPQGFSLGPEKEEPIKIKELTPEEKAEQEKHKKAMAFHELGIKQAQQERWEFALAKFDQCLKIEPDNRYALSDKANMHIKLRQYKEACETWALYKSFKYESDKVEGYIKTYCNK